MEVLGRAGEDELLDEPEPRGKTFDVGRLVDAEPAIGRLDACRSELGDPTEVAGHEG